MVRLLAKGLILLLFSISYGVLFAAPAYAQGTSVITGAVSDAATGKPVADVVVTATSPALQGEAMVITDGAGRYRLPNLPPGEYTLRADTEQFQPYQRGGIVVQSGVTVRLNVQMLPEALVSQEIVIVATPPTVDIGSTKTGTHIDLEQANRLPIVPPSGNGAASHSFEAAAAMAPGARSDDAGVALSGTTSPENRYVVDNLTTGSPGYGILRSPLSIEFIKEVNVVTGGYMPEYGNAIGGAIDVVTKTGSNEFHGSTFFNVTPGLLEGGREAIKQQQGTISTNQELLYLWDVGADVGGPIAKDKLWFYTGFAFNSTRYRLDRSLNRTLVDAAGNPLPDESGFLQSEPVQGTDSTYYASELGGQYIGKLTWMVNDGNSINVSTYGGLSVSGGNGKFPLSLGSGVNVGVINGQASALARRVDGFSNGLSLKWSGAFDNKSLLFDVTLGRYYETTAILPWDGAGIGSTSGFAAVPYVNWRRIPPHSVVDFETLPDASACAPATPDGETRCPVPTYSTGGPGFLLDTTANRYQARLAVTKILSAWGSHILKAGVDFEYVTSESESAFTGGAIYSESTDGSYFVMNRFGTLRGLNDPDIQDSFKSSASSVMAGGYVQDSWNIFDKVTLNLGVRYDAQTLSGNDDRINLSLGQQWSPRAGVIYDITQSGRSKIYASFARYQQNAPLAVADVAGSGPPFVTALVPTSVCNPRDPAQHKGACQDPENALPIGDPAEPTNKYIATGATTIPVDPDLRPQSSDEIVLGAEFEPVAQFRLGASYTKRYMNDVIENMSQDEGRTFFLGNPGRGMGAIFPEPKRDYDAVTVYAQKNFADTWLLDASYTVSWLRGNWTGLLRPENGQLAPGGTSDFDLQLLTINREGPLSSDRTHDIKVFGSKEFIVNGQSSVTAGLAYRAYSGEPLTHLGSHPIYGVNEVFILPRGSAGRMPWVHSIDGRFAYQWKVSKSASLSFMVDVFNIFNFQEETKRDQTYTYADVTPIANGVVDDLDANLKYIDGSPFNPEDRNPNFGKPLARQSPRTFRAGLKITL